MIEIQQLQLGEMQTNCFLINNPAKKCVIIDPGAEANKIIKLLQEQELELVAILVTHGHFDHIGGVNALVDELHVPVYAHEKESKMMKDPNKNLSSLFGNLTITCKANELIEDKAVLEFGEDLVFDVIEVPGHTSHSLCFYHQSGHLFTGDTLFKGSVGRTDLYSGDSRDLIKNIFTKLLKFPAETKVYPGHGLATTLNQEKSSNPYLITVY